MEEEKDTSEPKPISETVEEVASEGLGVNAWDRPAIFRETAEAAIANNLPYWMVLVLSGAIATLGLSLNSAAVVIGAMLVAPLLAPVVGLALALAVGDGRLAVQTGVVVAGSTAAVILISTLLTFLLPFHTITLEISARTRPSTLDLVIAVLSGLVGAVVTVARGRRLSAAIPGVAISVALIPPLAVAGFGIGSGWRTELIYGSMLLYGANLAGIVLSGMGVFLLVGMHRAGVVKAAIAWHSKNGEGTRGLIALADRSRWIRSIGVLRSAWARVGLVVLFVAAVWFPLRESLREIAREARLERAVATAEGAFQKPGQMAILNRQIIPGEGRTQVYLRVATAGWLGAEMRDEFERTASALAGEPVRLSLEQLPTSGGDVEQFTALLPARQAEGLPPGPMQEESLEAAMAAARTRLAALENLALPDGAVLAGSEMATTQHGALILRLAYAAPEKLGLQAEQMLRRQIQFALNLPNAKVLLVHLSTDAHPVNAAAPDTILLHRLADAVQTYDSLYIELMLPAPGHPADSTRLIRLLRRMGVDSTRIRSRRTPEPGPLRIRTAPASYPSILAGEDDPDV